MTSTSWTHRTSTHTVEAPNSPLEAVTCLRLPTHSPPPPTPLPPSPYTLPVRAILDITAVEKKVVQNPAVLAA